MKKLLFIIVLLMSTICLSGQIVSFETKIIIDGEQTVLLTESTNRDSLVTFLTKVIEVTNMSSAELGFTAAPEECPHIEVYGGDFIYGGSGSRAFPNNLWDVSLIMPRRPFYGNTSLPASHVFAALYDKNPKFYNYKIVAVAK